MLTILLTVQCTMSQFDDHEATRKDKLDKEAALNELFRHIDTKLSIDDLWTRLDPRTTTQNTFTSTVIPSSSTSTEFGVDEKAITKSVPVLPDSWFNSRPKWLKPNTDRLEAINLDITNHTVIPSSTPLPPTPDEELENITSSTTTTIYSTITTITSLISSTTETVDPTTIDTTLKDEEEVDFTVPQQANSPTTTESTRSSTFSDVTTSREPSMTVILASTTLQVNNQKKIVIKTKRINFGR